MIQLTVACSVCFGDPNSLMTRGSIFGILSLLLIIAGVLLAIYLTAVHWIKRAKSLNQSF